MEKKKKRKPLKPYRTFPLYAHASGQWAKKVKYKVYYFGPWADPQAALDRWLKIRDELLAGRTPEAWDPDLLTISECLNLALGSKQVKVDNGELSERCFSDYIASAKLVLECFGRDRPVQSLKPFDFQRLRSHLATGRNNTTLKNLIRRVRVLINWNWKNGHIDSPQKLWGTEFNLPTARAMRLERNEQPARFISALRIRELIESAPGQLKPMLLLGINCAYGPSDCTLLTWSDLDLKDGWSNLARNKTGKTRRAKLWPETIAALEAVGIGEGLVFRTVFGNQWTSTAICQAVRKIRASEESIGFYWLRHTFLTIGEETKDFEACRAVMGHIDARVTGQYRSMVSDERLETVSDYVRNWLFN